jgi:APA family basic amino acid/polyamine antiporter
MLLPVDGSPTAATAIGQGLMFPENDRIGASAASVMVGEMGVWLMAGLIMISTFGCNNGLILSGSRLFYAMAQDGLFFKKAAKLNSNNVPGIALWIQCFWACILCFSGKYSDLVVYSTFASYFFVITIAGIFVLRVKEPETPRPYKVIGYPIVPMIYIIITLAICFCLLIYDSKNAGMGLLIVLLGLPIYLFMSRKKSTNS